MASTGAQKKKVLFDESDDDSDGGVDIKINDEYAKRFEHNKKREELHRRKYPTFIYSFIAIYSNHYLKS